MSSTPASPALPDREREIRRVMMQILILNVAVAVAKAAYGLFSGSLAITSDAVHSTLDAASNVVGMLALRFAAAPPDAEHPYGHRKVEIVAAALIGVIIGGVALELGLSAVRALYGRTTTPAVTNAGFAIMAGTLAVNVFVALWERSRGRALKSPFLIADAAHTASDVVVTIGVLVSMVLGRAGLVWADPVASLLVILVIARVGLKILLANLDVLIDRAALDPDDVQRVVLAVDGVKGCHRVRSRGPLASAHLDLHIHVDGGMSLARAHALSHEVEARLRQKIAGLADVTVHVEPVGDPEES